MNHPPIETDYLVVGARATAMSFVDTLLTESAARIVIVEGIGMVPVSPRLMVATAIQSRGERAWTT